LLGILYAALGALTFALNNVTMRRGVVTGSVLQGMALTVPIGGLSFLVMTVGFGQLGQLVTFPRSRSPGWHAKASCISSSGATATTSPTS
jgi:hypothetical protein